MVGARSVVSAAATDNKPPTKKTHVPVGKKNTDCTNKHGINRNVIPNHKV